MDFSEWWATWKEAPTKSVWQERDAAIVWQAATAASREPMPCGHPRACIVVGTERRDGEYEQHCGWCEDVEQATAAERGRCAGKCERRAESHHVESFDLPSGTIRMNQLIDSAVEARRCAADIREEADDE